MMDEFSVDDYEMWSDEVADYFRFIRDQPNDELENTSLDVL